MTKIEKRGDLLDVFENGEVDYLCHCCNCQGQMGSGIALQIKNRFPAAYNAYKDFHSQNGLSLGTVSEAVVLKDLKIQKIFNLHAQEFCGYDGGRYVDYDALRECLENLLSRIEYGKSLGIPKYMCCGLAGGDWKIVEHIIDDVFDKKEIKIVIVEYDDK